MQRLDWAHSIGQLAAPDITHGNRHTINQRKTGVLRMNAVDVAVQNQPAFRFCSLNRLRFACFMPGNVPGLQVYVVQLAEKYTPNAVDIAAGLNIAAFNVGIAIGSVMGGVIVEKMTLMDTPWIAAIIVVLALALTRLSGFLDSRDQTETTQVQWNSFLTAQRSPTQGL